MGVEGLPAEPITLPGHGSTLRERAPPDSRGEWKHRWRASPSARSGVSGQACGPSGWVSVFGSPAHEQGGKIPAHLGHQCIVRNLAQDHPHREPAAPTTPVLKHPATFGLGFADQLHVRETAGARLSRGDDSSRVEVLRWLPVGVLHNRGHGSLSATTPRVHARPAAAFGK